MANQPKKYQKFVATAATATLVASAIVPVASAKSFTDTDSLAEVTKAELDRAVELGLMSGIGNEFQPYVYMNRGQVAKALAKYIAGQDDQTIAEYYETNELANNVKAFDDVPASTKDQELYQASLIVKDAGVFTGLNNKLSPASEISRQHMAKVLVNAFGLEATDEEVEIKDLDKAVAEHRDNIVILAQNGVTLPVNGMFKPADSVKRIQMASFLVRAYDAVAETTPAIDSVKSIDKDTVQVVLNTEVDAVKAENFTIEGGKVVSAELDKDNQTVTLKVSGLKYDTKYTVKADKISVDGEDTDFGSKEFTTVEASVMSSIKIEAADAAVTADGADNTVVTFSILDKNGNVDTNANNMVLAIESTFGNLANNRVTIKNGVGKVVLSSEFSSQDMTARVTAQVIEASGDYKEQIGKLVGEGTVNFKASGAALDPNAITFADAESNQADRVVLYFDKAVAPQTFVKFNETKGEFVTKDSKSKDEKGKFIKKQVMKDNVNVVITQDGKEREILGFDEIDGNPRAIEVILAKEDVLRDNAKVQVKASIGKTNNDVEFNLTDARQPEMTNITPNGLRGVTIKFSESVHSGNFTIDGLYTAKDFDVKYGEFNAAKGDDHRDQAELTLKKSNKKEDRYFKAGQHSLTVTNLTDFAGLSDKANVSSTQTLPFVIEADTSAPTATVKVESPEQFRVTFDKIVDNEAAAKLFTDAFRVYDKDAKKYVKPSELKVDGKAVFAKTPVFAVQEFEGTAHDEFVVELTEDWTQLLANKQDAYYNYDFAFEIKKDAFENVANGITNSEFELHLSYTGSKLTEADNVSPTITAIDETSSDNTYIVTMDEPVKLPGKDNAGDTINTQQGQLPAIQVEFQGKDENGKHVAVKGELGHLLTDVDANKVYADNKGEDVSFYVSTGKGKETLTDLVNKGYSTEWKVVVRSISDDVGNTAATLTKDFKVSPTANSQFYFVSPDNNKELNKTLAQKVIAYDNTTGKDYLDITFSKAVVNTGGINDLTSQYNWTLNGKQLENVESIKVYDTDNNTKNGYERVVITFNDANVLKSTQANNVIAVNKNLVSKDGSQLVGKNEIVALTQAGQPNFTEVPTPGTGYVVGDFSPKFDNNPVTGEIILSIDRVNLPVAQQGVEKFDVMLDGKKIGTVEVNEFKTTELVGEFPKTLTQDQLKKATLAPVGGTPAQTTVQSLVDAGGVTFLTNPVTGKVVFNVEKAKLTGDLAGATELKLVVDGKVVATVKENQFNQNFLSSDVHGLTEEQIKAGTLTK